MSTTDERTAGPAPGSEEDPYGAAADAAEGHVYTVTGQDWDSIVSEQAERGDERIVVNMGPAASLHARRTAVDLGIGGRIGHRGPLRHRLSAHRHRKEHGVP